MSDCTKCGMWLTISYFSESLDLSHPLLYLLRNEFYDIFRLANWGSQNWTTIRGNVDSGVAKQRRSRQYKTVLGDQPRLSWIDKVAK